MKRFFFDLLKFAAYFSIIYLIMVFAWGEYSDDLVRGNLDYTLGGSDFMFTRMKEVKKVRDVDILFLGSSHTYRGFDTRIFKKHGYSCFNLGSSSQTPIETRILLKRYLDRLNPKLIIYEVYPGTFSVDGVESSLDILSNDANDINSFWMTLEMKHLMVFNTFLYASMRDLFDLNKDYKEPLRKHNEKYIPGGYVESKVRNHSNEHIPKRSWSFNEAQFSAFRDIVDELQERQIKTVLVYAPITKAYLKSHRNNKEFDKRIEKYHLPYFDFNKMMKLSDTKYFADRHHLNQNGVEKFNDKLLQVFVEKGVLAGVEDQ